MDFRDGQKTSGEKVKHIFKEKRISGQYGVDFKSISKTAINNKSGVSKKILVVDENQGEKSYLANSSEKRIFPEIEKQEIIR